MKRTDYLLPALALALLMPPSFADDAHHPGQATPKAAAAGAPTTAPKPVAAPAETTGERAEAPLLKAQALMERIRQSRDPAERRQLMHEHMQAMREGMAMMREMGPVAGGGMMRGAARAGDAPAGSARGMAGGHEMMAKRMTAMQQLMEQLLEHEAARDTAPRP